MRVRLAVFAAGAVGFATLLGFGVAGLSPFGHYPGPYGNVLNRVEPQERHAANVVTSVVFDYRGFDTLGEELILFAAVMGVALLLREVREEGVADVRDEMAGDAIRAVGLVAVPVVVLLSLDLVTHGTLTPGGGFQGGVVGAAGLLLVYVAGDWRSYRRAGPTALVDGAEAVGAGGYAVVGLAMLIAGGAFLENLLPFGTFGELTAGGMIQVVNLCAGLEVAAAFVLLFGEFVEELLEGRGG